MNELVDITSEERLIGILLNSPDKLGDMRLSTTLFSSGLYREALRTAMNLRFRGQGVDPVSMGLESKNDEVGELCAKVQARRDMGAGYEQLVATLQDHSLRRRASKVCKAGYEACFDLENDVGPVIDGLERDVLNIRQGGDDGMADGSDQRDVMDELRWRMENPGGVRGMRFGFPILESILDGLHGGQLYVIGARPSVGKTALMTTMILNLLQQGKCPAVFSLEMKGVLLKSRILSALAGVAVAKKEGHTDNEVDRLNDAIRQLQGMKWFYKDNARMDIDKIVSLSRRLRTSERLDAIFVDYLQIIQNSRYKGADVRNRVAENCFMLKQLGEELDVPVIVPAQLRRKEGFFNRATKETERAKPELEDLKECLSISDSFLFTNNGVQGNVDSTMNLYTLNNSKITLSDSENVPRKSAPTIRVVLRSGREIVCTRRHLVMTDWGWTPARNLTADHAIASVRKIHAGDGLRYVPEAKWIGWMLGNGHMSGQASPSFSCSCDKTAEEFKDVTINLFGVDPKPNPHWQSKKVIQFRLTASNVRKAEGNPVTNWLKANELWGATAPDKSIPDWFLSCADDRSIAELVAGLIETDGSVYSTPVPTVSFSSTSHKLMLQAIWCLNRLGIFARMDEGREGSMAKRPSYKMVIQDGPEIMRFRKAVQLAGRKGDALQALKPSSHGSNHGDRLGSWVSDEIARRAKLAGISWKQLGYRPQGKRISQEDLRKVINSFDSHGVSVPREIRDKLQPDIFWDRLKRIEDAGKRRVFDRSVPVSHNFVCNGVVVHNCGDIEQDADVVMLLDRDQTSNAAYSEIRVAKQRNGPVGTVAMAYNPATSLFKEDEEATNWI